LDTFAFVVFEVLILKGRRKNNEFISLLCVCVGGTLESRHLISHVFLIIRVAVQANPKIRNSNRSVQQTQNRKFQASIF
jgi:hypothetical protein